MSSSGGPTIVARFLADTSQMVNEVEKGSTSAGSKIKNFAKNAALAVGGAFAVDKVIEFGKASVEAAAADAEAQAKLATTLRNVTGATDSQIASNEKFISGLSKQTAIADDDLRPAMDSLVRGFGSVEKAQAALALSTDVAAGTGKDLSTVTEAMMKAANGQTGALGRLGIATKDSSGKALSLDQIMANMSRTFKGQAAEAADHGGRKMRGAKVQFGEFQEQIGTALLPVLSTLAGFFVDKLIPAISAVANWIGDNKELMIAAFIGLGTVVAGVVVPSFIAWATAAGAAAIATLTAAAPFIAIGAAVAAVAYLIIHNWDTIVAATKVAWDAVVGAVQWVWHWIVDNWPTLLAVITGPIGIAVLLISKNWDTIKDGATAVWQWIVSVWNGITGAIGSAVSAVGGFIGRMVGYLRQPMQAATDVFNWVSGKFQALVSFISGIVGQIASVAGSIADAIKKPINAVIGMWNRMEFRIPDFTLPSFDVGPIHLGGQHFGGATIGFPDLPTLAGGGVLTAPTLFIGGEAGTEIVAPEDMLRAIVGEEAGGSYTLNLYPRTADAADVAYGFRRLELMAGL